MARENNNSRLLQGALFCLIGATNLTFSSDSKIDTNSSLQKIRDSYVTECLDLSFIAKIQIARNPDRRRQLAIQCSEKNLRKRAHAKTDAEYQSISSDDLSFRAQMSNIDKDPLFLDQKGLGIDTRFQTQRFKTNSEDTTDQGIDTGAINTLDGYTTSSDD